MKPIHPKYKINKKDTLSKITERFGIEEGIWIRYHNNMCTLDDIIWDNLPSHLKEIYLLPELWDNEIALNNSLPNIDVEGIIVPSVLKNDNIPTETEYGCRYIFTHGKKEQQVKFEISVKLISKLTYQTIFEIDRISPVYIDDLLPDTLVDNLAFESGKIFYPLQIKVDQFGQYKSIVNHKEIQDRWKIKRKELTDYFKGAEVEKYLSLMDDVVCNESRINEIFETDLLITTYFYPIYKSYPKSQNIKEESVKFPLIKKRFLQFQVKETIFISTTAYDAIELRHEGELKDQRTVDEIENGSYLAIQKETNPEDFVPATGNYQGLYSLDAMTNEIRYYTGKWILDLTQKREIELRIMRKDNLD